MDVSVFISSSLYSHLFWFTYSRKIAKMIYYCITSNWTAKCGHKKTLTALSWGQSKSDAQAENLVARHQIWLCSQKHWNQTGNNIEIIASAVRTRAWCVSQTHIRQRLVTTTFLFKHDESFWQGTRIWNCAPNIPMSRGEDTSDCVFCVCFLGLANYKLSYYWLKCLWYELKLQRDFWIWHLLLLAIPNVTFLSLNFLGW